MLAKALAHYYGAKLLIFDSHSFLGVRFHHYYYYGAKMVIKFRNDKSFGGFVF